ncbi:MAG: Phage portal protein Gp6 [Herbinix sp.]|jgi:hypothetical protein|nr:Phage portal protein Gp6 [Herbinix sp.]
MTINEYRLTFDNPERWFADEVMKGYHTSRIANVRQNKDYLARIHKVLNRENSQYKGKELVTRKTILQYAKTVLNFHSTYLLGKQVSLSGDEAIVKQFNDIYKKGLYSTTDFEILDRVNKFGDAFEYTYIDNGKIKSKVFDSAESYPVYTDNGEYVAFIEHWTDAYSAISYYNVYYPDRVDKWSNEGGYEKLVESKVNLSGLPIHYHNFNDSDYNFGESMLADIVPILDELEDIISKMGDAIYINSLNPLPVAIGQRVDSSIPADATGYVLNMDTGSFDYATATMDYNTIKLYLDNVKQFLNDIASMPSVISGNSNVSNVSEVTLSMLFHMANIKAMETEKWLNKGMQERFTQFKALLNRLNINVDGNIDIEYNLSIPIAMNEVINNLKALREMNAISIDTVMEKSEYIRDTAIEKNRIASESNRVEQDNKQV